MKTEVIVVDQESPDKKALEKAAQIIKRGGLVAFPTETVYGLGANYLDKMAVENLFAVKDRDRSKPFTIHISALKVLGDLDCEVSAEVKNLLNKYWPGPLTVILNTRSGEKLGFRMPKNNLALEFISLCEVPIVVPSANISGKRPPKNARQVLEDLNGKIELVLDGGETKVGIESTVCDVTARPVRISRKGAFPEGEILQFFKQVN